MHQHHCGVEQALEVAVPGSEMVNPDRRVDEDHAGWALRGLGPAARRRFESALRPAQPGKAARAFALDKSLERLAYQARLLGQAREALRFGNKIVVQSKRRAHAASFDKARN
jgi:hypothetical protein